ncbi:dihydrofolate synthetase [Tolypocladium capitatum]|uniref:Dihydrofolate synthetase n=1 Tax=Tolypocladium capitatum TaxID=45235 RepID=A0A2K3QJ35_9HYPO|nr:dihydrofolate synthetase [Tolypocladium capitatum]
MHPTHLIVVCCHGIWRGGPSKGADESEWLIAPFQRGETGTFVRHAEEGVRRLAQSREDSILIFSGGPTRRETDTSEAQSYASLAAHNAYWGLLAPPVTGDDVLLEERALDSYHNVLLGLTRYHGRFGAWPASLTLVGHAFKRPRLEAHCAAIGYPLGRVAFAGIDPPGLDGDAATRDGAARALAEWARDPHGRGPELAGKRRARNPWGAWQGVFGRGVEDRGGLVTREEGEGETLVEDAPRPW